MTILSQRTAAVIWMLGFTVIVSFHAVWELLDEGPAVWDMAYHQLQGWRYLAAWQDGRFFEQFAALSTYYPPLYYLQEALILSIFPGTQFVALLSNLIGMLLLSGCSYRLAAIFMRPAAAVVTGLLPLLFPLLAWTSRVSLLDLSLAGWVAAAGYLLAASDSLKDRWWVLAFGLVCAAGSLTKWTFVLFLLPPLAHLLIYSPRRRTSLIHLGMAACLALPFVVLWYLPNLSSLVERFQITTQAGLGEGDPGWGSILGWIYYPRSLTSYYLYLPLTGLGLWGAVRADRPGEGTRGHRLIQFSWWWLLGGLLVMTLIPAKDPRYIMPLACPLALLLVAPWRKKDSWVMGILVLAFLQFLSISFLTSPLKIALFDEKEISNYRGVRREWVLFQTHYFDVLGPPRKEDWKIGQILDVLGSAGRIGCLPDAARFNPNTLELAAVGRNLDLKFVFLGDSRLSARSLSEFEFVIGKTGSQGMSDLTAWNQPNYHLLEALDWELVRSWELPDQSRAQLWRNPGGD
ncbi:MAG: glycosyltransferase family 39 protein [Acidobacteriota bacterium]